MSRPFFSLVLLAGLVLATGCGSDAPPAGTATEAEVRLAEAEARRAEAEARVAEAQAAAPDVDASAPADDPEAAAAAPAPAAGGASSGSTSTRPGRTGLPPATAGPTYTTLVDGTQPFRFCQTYRQSAVSRYEGMELCYSGTIRQEGTRVVGSGEKDSENGRTLRGAARTGMQIEGYLYEDLSLRFNFTDAGARRVARGSANFPEAGYNGGCEGHGWRDATFQTDAANSSGSATFFIEQDCGV